MQIETTGSFYDEIKLRLASCATVEEYVSAYKWLATQLVEINESAKNFENKVIEKYGEEAYGILAYGSEEAYAREQEFDARIKNASTSEERQAIALERMLTTPLYDEPEIPDLWGGEEAGESAYTNPELEFPTLE